MAPPAALAWDVESSVFSAFRGEMTKADLVEKVTATIARTAGPMISKKDCARVIDAFLEAVKGALADQHNIEIRGFGTFKIRNRKTRMARNPRTEPSRQVRDPRLAPAARPRRLAGGLRTTRYPPARGGNNANSSPS